MIFNFFNNKRSTFIRQTISAQQPDPVSAIPASLDEAVSEIKRRLGESPDITFRPLTLGDIQIQASLVFVQSLTESSTINSQIIDTIVNIKLECGIFPPTVLFEKLENEIPVNFSFRIESLQGVIDVLLRGHAVLFIDSTGAALGMNAAGWPMRNVKEPMNENEVRGPRESFIESLNTNMSLIRRKISDEKLRFDSFELGDKTKTRCCVAYMAGIAPDSLVDEVKRRIGCIRMRGVLESNYIEEWIQDHPNSLFPQIDITEKPDRAAAMLLEGRVIIITDGTPFVLIAPTVFLQLFTTAGDYYMSHWFASFLRFLRMFAFLISLLTPSLYIAITTMHQEMIPTQLALRIAGARSEVPLPAIVEAMIMETAFELLREAGIRLPKVAGQAVSIVGALIIGEAAVQAGIVSPIMVIVVAITGISSLTLPNFGLSLAVRLIRFPLMIIASILGIPGIAIVMLVLLTYLASMKSFGLPYLSPLSYTVFTDWKDTVFRMPLREIGKGKHRFGKSRSSLGEFDPEESST